MLRKSRTRSSAARCGRRASGWAASSRPELKRLVRLRNKAARQLGFKDYHVMQLAFGEQSQEEVLRLFDELDALTREPFHAAKAEIDAALARQLRHRGRASCGPGTTTIRSSRSRPPCSATLRRGLRAAGHPQAVPRVLRRHRAADRRRAARAATVREAGQEPARLLHRHRPRRATSACWPTSCPTRNGWPRCCTSWATRSTPARTFPAACLMCSASSRTL